MKIDIKLTGNEIVLIWDGGTSIGSPYQRLTIAEATRLKDALAKTLANLNDIRYLDNQIEDLNKKRKALMS